MEPVNKERIILVVCGMVFGQGFGDSSVTSVQEENGTYVITLTQN